MMLGLETWRTIFSATMIAVRERARLGLTYGDGSCDGEEDKI